MEHPKATKQWLIVHGAVQQRKLVDFLRRYYPDLRPHERCQIGVVRIDAHTHVSVEYFDSGAARDVMLGIQHAVDFQEFKRLLNPLTLMKSEVDLGHLYSRPKDRVLFSKLDQEEALKNQPPMKPSCCETLCIADPKHLRHLLSVLGTFYTEINELPEPLVAHSMRIHVVLTDACVHHLISIQRHDSAPEHYELSIQDGIVRAVQQREQDVALRFFEMIRHYGYGLGSSATRACKDLYVVAWVKAKKMAVSLEKTQASCEEVQKASVRFVPKIDALIDAARPVKMPMLAMTTALRDAIEEPANGTQIYNQDTHAVNVFDGGFWRTEKKEVSVADFIPDWPPFSPREPTREDLCKTLQLSDSVSDLVLKNTVARILAPKGSNVVMRACVVDDHGVFHSVGEIGLPQEQWDTGAKLAVKISDTEVVLHRVKVASQPDEFGRYFLFVQKEPTV